MPGVPLRTTEAVDCEQPACWATSVMVTRLEPRWSLVGAAPPLGGALAFSFIVSSGGGKPRLLVPSLVSRPPPINCAGGDLSTRAGRPHYSVDLRRRT